MGESCYSTLERAVNAYRRDNTEANLKAILAQAASMAHELDGDAQCVACDEWVPLEEAELDAEGWVCDNCAYSGREENDNG